MTSLLEASGIALGTRVAPLDFVSATQTCRAAAAMYPGHRFEVLICTRSMRLKMSGATGSASATQPKAAQKFAGKLLGKFGQSFADAFLKSCKTWPIA